MNAKEKIEFLRNCCKEYELTGKSPISDAEYDKLYDEMKQTCPNDDFFNEAGATLDEHVYGKRIKHEITMGSLNKCANFEEFKKWINNTYKEYENIEVMIQHKIDGLSLGCVYKNGKLQSVSTRGDGFTGIDVTNNAKFVNGIPQSITCKDETEIRGECYKDKKDFYENWVGEYANPRNFCAGAINQKDPLVTKERGLSFVSYEVVRKKFNKETEKVAFLVSQKFNIIDKGTMLFSGTKKEVFENIKEYMDSINREDLPYSIDGLVVKINDNSIKEKMGYVSDGKRAKANVAIKFPCEQVVATIKNVNWTVGKTGKVVPVGILEPVILNETTVQRVTLHNIKFISEMGLSIGSQILIQKSGDIIPYCVRKVKDGNKQIDIPDVCPSCSENLVWDNTNTTKVCNNTQCVSKLKNKIDYYVKSLGIKGIGPAIIETLIEKQYVSCISDMYDLEKHSNNLKDLFGDKALQNIFDAINSVKEVTLAKFIESISIANIGRMSKILVEKFPEVNDIDNATIEEIVSIDGFAFIKAKKFVDGWNEQREEIQNILSFVKIVKPEIKSGNLNGKSFCITGTLSMPRKEIQAMIESNGGKISSSVSSKLDYLVCGEDCGSKKAKAEKAGVKMISERELKEMAK